MTVHAQFPDEQNDDGSFARQKDAFDGWIGSGAREFPPEPGRYHLYVSYACPWAHRTIIVRALMGLEQAIGMSVVDPIRDELGWAFRPGNGHGIDEINGFAYLSEAYAASDPGYRGRVTVPVLWDKQRKQIVSNNDDDIMRMFETRCSTIATHPLELYPKRHAAEIDTLNARMYDAFNNGVYKAGFATSQAAYERAAFEVFDFLDEMEDRLSGSPFLFGDSPVESDWRFFVTLVRFDPVYHGHFKCNLRRITDYRHLSRYLRDLYDTDGVAATVNFDHIKRHYYVTHDDINPTRIVPIGPILDLATG